MHWLSRGLIVCFVGCMSVSMAVAQESPPLASAADWPMLIERRNEVFGRLTEIQQALAAAEGTEADELRTEGRQLLDQLYTDLLPKMRDAAVALLKQETLDEATAADIIELAYRSYQENKFDAAARLADGVIAKQPENVNVLANAMNVAGVAHFANEEFEKSARILGEAEEKELLNQLGMQYLDSARDYIDYWQAEQAIRQKEAAATGDEQLPRVLLKTSRGDMTVELFENEAPNTVANFISLVESGFYDGTKFHRVIGAFMAQGGDPNTKEGNDGPARAGGPGYTIQCEAEEPDSRRHFAGTLSMAHAGKDTGSSQFFITHLPTPHLDKGVAPEPHTVFGRVVDGLDVARSLKVGDELESATVIRKRDHEYVPETMPE
jgi:cyclophilin family peptidyl-prolyl cis-trans isomerase